jgi:hypothetical protein
MSDGMDQLVRRAAEATFPGMVEKLEGATAGVFDFAHANWPVRTGRSKAALGREVRVAPDWSAMRGRVFDDAPYAKFIKSPQIRTGSGSAFVDLLRKPTETAGLKLANDLRDTIERTLGSV